LTVFWNAFRIGFQGDAAADSIERIGFEFVQQPGLVLVVKRIHNLIGQAHKAVNIKDGTPQVSMQHFDGRRKTTCCSGGLPPGCNRSLPD
jgi:hypothetical protein